MVREAILQYLEKNGIMQKFLAEKTGMSTQAICKFLKGERKLDIDEYVKICNALNVPYSFFIETRKTA